MTPTEAADLILGVSESAMRHYMTQNTRDAILNATRADILAAVATVMDAARADALEEAAKLRTALESVMVGGNHLAHVIGADHPSFKADHETALNHYGSSDQFDVWCYWRAIMHAREALKPKP